jgi:chemosensory pili system protein ChpA (sensor histidine kinase/response regulator)
MLSNTAAPGDLEAVVNDLGPLAWVLEELRKSLDGATKAMRRFVRDAELARGSELTDIDASHLRVARQQLHQAVGALEMVGMSSPAKVLRAMEALAQKFVQNPQLCSEDAASKMERASFALTEYLEGLLKGKDASPVALFPQYRAVLELAGAERVHPADLWQSDWRWADVELPEATPLTYSTAVREKVDWAVLNVVKTGDAKAARRMCDVSVGLAAGQTERMGRSFWAICAGYFEAVALGLCPYDVYGKRSASRVLQQYSALAKGMPDISERLAQDLLFFCSLSVPKARQKAPLLNAVRSAYGLSVTKTVNYETEQFGRYDPALLVLARKRIASAAETWSGLAGGDTNRLKMAGEQFGAVAESMVKLHAESEQLARALSKAIDATVASGQAPLPAVSMEVATTILYLEAAYEDLDPTDSQMVERGARLAERLQRVVGGGSPEPMELWMEDLYRRVSDRQTMGSVVAELRTTLDEVEKSLDQFFRAPQDKSPLREVPSQLAQMRGVFSVLGLDQPALAALRMRASVDKFLVDEVDEESAKVGIFEKLGNSLGAMGFLIDMLSYQRELAKKLFVYDEELGELKPLMGRERFVEPVSVAAEVTLPEVAQTAPAPTVATPSVPAPVPTAPMVATPAMASPSIAVPAVAPLSDDGDDGELLDIFLEEARGVVVAGLDALKALATDPADLAEQTILRRAFHTLKGSSRMVGLTEFGEAAWSYEQMLNTWLAEQRPASDDLLSVAGDGLRAFGRWVEDIAAQNDVLWSSHDFRNASDGLRLENKVVPLVTPGMQPLAEPLLPLDAAHSGLMDVDLDLELPPLPELDWAMGLKNGPESVRDFGAAEPMDYAELQAFEAPGAKQLTDEFRDATDVIKLDLGDFNFADLGTPVPTAAAPVVVDATPLELEGPAAAEPQTQSVALDDVEVVDTTAADLAVAPLGSGDDADENLKVIGTLRLSIPLYNVYLNEADEWSRLLQVELNEWALELHKPLPESSIVLAHSLLGSSATVGFTALSDIARALEQALLHVQLHRQGTAEHSQVFNAAADDIRRLLHQFAAGFLKEPDAAILEALQAITDTNFAAPTLDTSFNVLDEPASSQDTEIGGLEVESAVLPDDSTLPVPVPVAVAAGTLSPAPAPQPAPPVVAPAVTLNTTPELGQSLRAAQMAMVAAPLNIAQAHDDDIDAVDNLDVDLFPIFDEEAAELLPQLGSALRQWIAHPDNHSARNEVLRVLHTLKGSARLAGAMRLGEMSHRMESSIEQLGSEHVQAVQLEPLLTRLDDMQAAFANLGKAPLDETSRVEDLPVAEVVVEKPKADKPTALAAGPTAAATVVTPLSAVAHVRPAAPPAVRARSNRPSENQSVRVRSKLLDRLVNQAGEVLITRSRMDARLTQWRTSLEELGGNLDRLRQQLRDVELQAESQMQSRLAQTKDSAQAFDPLEFDRFTRVQELTRMMAESVNDVATVQRNLQRSVEGTEDDLIAQGRQTRELQRDLLRTRMVEFESLSDRLYGVVRQAAKDTSKQVKLDITGGSIEMDRGVLERMAPAFEHMLRNAVAHGIEEASERASQGKAAAGTITIHIEQQSNDVSVAFSDDGEGLHLDRIRAKAIENGVIAKDDDLSESDAANLIFTPGFSTAEKITELAGRGIGMDVVRSEVTALGGRIETATALGKGTTFKLVLPLTTAVTQVVILRMGEFTIGVPSSLFETVLRVPAAVLEQAYSNDVFDMAGQAVPFFWAGALLQVSARSAEAPSKTLPVALFRSAGQRLAVHVDEILGNRAVVVKNLGPQLSRLPGLSGMSVLASGAVVLIYNPVALAAVYGDQARQLRNLTSISVESVHAGAGQAGSNEAAPGWMAATSHVPLVLVVDDSITVRRVTQRLLKREGYRVALAADGLQALEKLLEEKPAVVLSDIEMPRMDGFDLARNIRGDARLRDLPIIMITSRIAEKHREHAKELGVDHYLGKPYSEDELLALVRSYCAATTEP